MPTPMSHQTMIETIIERSIVTDGDAFTVRQIAEFCDTTPARVRRAVEKETDVNGWTRIRWSEIYVPTFESNYRSRKGSSKSAAYSVQVAEVCRRYKAMDDSVGRTETGPPAPPKMRYIDCPYCEDGNRRDPENPNTRTCRNCGRHI